MDPGIGNNQNQRTFTCGYLKKIKIKEPLALGIRKKLESMNR
jgi:hypothetical protein